MIEFTDEDRQEVRVAARLIEESAQGQPLQEFEHRMHLAGRLDSLAGRVEAEPEGFVPGEATDEFIATHHWEYEPDEEDA